MKNLINAMNDLPWILKLVLCIPALDIIWCIVRLLRSLDKNNPVGIVLAILTIVPGAAFVWIVDIVCVLLKGEIWWID